MIHRYLPLLCLAAVLAAPLSAQTIESAKAASDGALPSASIPKISDVCFGRGPLVAATRDSLEKAEKGVETRGAHPDDPKGMSVGEGVDLVLKNAASNNGQCVAKTVLAYLNERGELASTLILQDNGQTIALFVSSFGGPILYKGASEVGGYAMQVLTYRLSRLAAADMQSSDGRCHRGAGKDDDQRSCPRHGYEKYGDAEITAAPWPSGGSDVRGGKDADQMPSERPDPHE